MTDIVPVFIGYLFNLTHYKLSTTKSWQSPISTNNACDIVIQCKNRVQRVEINTSLTLIRTLQQLHLYYIGSRNMKTNANTPHVTTIILPVALQQVKQKQRLNSENLSALTFPYI